MAAEYIDLPPSTSTEAYLTIKNILDLWQSTTGSADPSRLDEWKELEGEHPSGVPKQLKLMVEPMNQA